MVYTDLYTAVKLNGWEEDQASGAEITVKDFNQLQTTEDYYVKGTYGLCAEEARFGACSPRLGKSFGGLSRKSRR
jgi:hypothetical protein